MNACTCRHLLVDTNTYKYTPAHIYIHTRTHLHTHTHACTHARTQTHIDARTHARAHILTHAQTHKHTHAHKHTNSIAAWPSSLSMYLSLIFLSSMLKGKLAATRTNRCAHMHTQKGIGFQPLWHGFKALWPRDIPRLMCTLKNEHTCTHMGAYFQPL